MQTLQLINLPEEQHEWDTFHIPLDQGGIEFQPRSLGNYELVFIREPSSEDLHPIWKTFPQSSEYKTRDLLSKHPTIPDRWKFESRTDDLIAFANANKYNPLAYEEYTASNALVRSAFMIGNKRPFPALLVELVNPIDVTDTARYNEALDSVWETVQAANADAPKHAYVRKELVMLASPAKPFERAAKGTPVRQRTLDLYGSEIDDLYKACTETGAAVSATIPAAVVHSSGA